MRFILSLLLVTNSVWAEATKVGLIIPLSGVAADYGIAIQRGFELAQQRHPTQFDNIEFIFEDVGYDPKIAIQAFHKLRSQDQVDLIYTWGVSFCKALAPLADQFKMPTVGQCIDPESSRGRRYFVRFQNSSDDYVELLSTYLSEHKFHRIGIVLAEHPYQEGMLSALRRHLRANQQIEVVERYPQDQADFRTLIQRWKSENFDAVGVYLYPGQGASFFKQAQSLHYRPTFFGTNILESSSELRAAAGSMDGTLLVGHAVNDWYFQALVGKYGEATQLSFSALAYDFAMHLSASLAEAKSSETRLEAILQTRSGEGEAAGPYHLVESSDAGKFFSFSLRVNAVAGLGFRPTT